MNWQEWLILILLSILWGSSFFFVEIALRDMLPLTIVFFRVGIAALVLWALVFYLKIPLPKNVSLWLSFLIMGLLNNALPFGLIVWGQTEITAGLASILNATTPLFTIVVASSLLADERLTFNKALGCFIGFAGVILMIGPANLFTLGQDVLAQLAVCGGALSYALAGVFGRRYKKYQLHPILLAASQVTAAAILLLPFVLWQEASHDFGSPKISSWLSIIGIALFSTALAYVLYFRVLASSGATNVLLVAFLIPISGVLFGIIFLKETLLVVHIIGMLSIGIGLAIIDGRIANYIFRKS